MMELLAELKRDKGFSSLLKLKEKLRKVRHLPLDLTLSYKPSLDSTEAHLLEEMKQAKTDSTNSNKQSR